MSLITWGKVLCLLAAVPLILGAVLVPAVAGAHSAAGPSGPTSSIRIHLIAIGDNGKAGTRIGCSDSLIAVKKRIPHTTAPLSAAVRLTIRDHRRFYGQSGLYNALYQSSLQLIRATVVNGTASVYLAGQLRLGGVCDSPRIRAQLRHAALQFSTVHRVYVYVNGVLLSKALSSR